MLPFSPPRLNIAQLPTPLRPLDRLSALYSGPRIWIKQDDLTGSALTGNKVRKLEFVVADALAEQCDTLVTCGGVQSNHCRATVLTGARFGLKVHLLLRGNKPNQSDGNLLLDELGGAEITFYDDDEYVRDFPAIAEHWLSHYKAQGKKPYFIPTGASNGVGLWGYLSAAEELKRDCEQAGFRPDAIVVATGSAGTQGGLTLGEYLLGSNVPVYGMAVCDSSAYFKGKVEEDISDWYRRWSGPVGLNKSLPALLGELNILTLDNYIGPGYAQGYPALYRCIKEVASREGVVLDPVYTGKAFYGMLEERQNGVFSRMDNIVFVHTGGVYGLFPQRAEFT